MKKNIKFAMLLSIASMMGIQAGQAGVVHCPQPDKMNKPVVGKSNTIYTGNTTGTPVIEMNGHYKNGFVPDFTRLPVRTQRLGHMITCLYGKEIGEEFPPAVLVAFHHNCHAYNSTVNKDVPDGEPGDVFDCP